METKTLLPLALSYLNKGWSVIICGQDKTPLIPWKEFQERLATVEELVKWFNIYPTAQVGIITGAISNLTVVDFESDADFSLIDDKTYTVESGRKGRHYYFTYEKDFQNAVKILPSVDIRSQGGFVVAAGSTTKFGAYSVLSDAKVAQMSEKTKTLLLGAKNGQKEGMGEKSIPWYVSSGTSLYPKITTEGLEYQGVNQGGRNDAMTKFAGSIMARLHPSLWGSIGWKIFEEANQKNTPPLPLSELRATWLSISSKETKANPDGRRYDFPQEKTWGPDPNRHLSQGTKKFDEKDVSHEMDESKETLHASEVAALQVIDTDHTYPSNFPPIDEALLGGFTLGDLVVVMGDTGVGKTSLVQDWTVTLASGGQDGKNKLPVLWFSYEVLAKPLWQKFQTMGATIDMPIYMPKINETGDIDWVLSVIEQAIQKWGIKVVAIDHVGFLNPPKGNYANSADAIKYTVTMLKAFANKHGLIIFIPAHIKKTWSKIPNLNDIKDAKAIVDLATTVFYIGREKDDDGLQTSQAKVSLLKNRKTGIGVSVMLDFQFGRYYYNASGNEKKEDTGIESFETEADTFDVS